jgi:hypothetical protein
MGLGGGGAWACGCVADVGVVVVVVGGGMSGGWAPSGGPLMHRQQQLAKQQRGERSHRQTGQSGLAGYLFGVRGAGCGVGYQAAQRWTGVLSWLWPNMVARLHCSHW